MNYTRICTTCGVEKPLTEFRQRVYSSGTVARRNTCKKCQSEYSARRWREKHPPKRVYERTGETTKRAQLTAVLQKHGLWKDAS